jgi:hypothetical protein
VNYLSGVGGDGMSTWLFIYLAGCVVAVLLSVASVVLFSALQWILKGNIIRRNLKKLDETENESFWSEFGTATLLIALSAALSWIQVLITLVGSLWKLLEILRELFVNVPETIKKLRFPLQNNPDMSREAVWAYVRAIEAKAGANLFNAYGLLSSLQSVIDNHKDFDSHTALQHLRALDAVSSEVIDAAMKRIEAHEKMLNSNAAEVDGG